MQKLSEKKLTVVGAGLSVLIYFSFLTLTYLHLDRTISEYEKGYHYTVLGFEFIKDKTLEKDGIQIRLIGMSHIANKSFYKDIQSDIDKIQGRTITLAEGVTNKRNTLKIDMNYAEIAKNFSVSSQDDSITFPNSRGADIDFIDFDPKTIMVINKVFNVINNEIPKGASAADLEKFKKEVDSINMTDVDYAIKHELLKKRNDHLIKQIRGEISGKKFKNILVPWGALHLQEIENELTGKLGFKVTSEESRYSMSRTFYELKLAFKSLVNK